MCAHGWCYDSGEAPSGAGVSETGMIDKPLAPRGQVCGEEKGG